MAGKRKKMTEKSFWNKKKQNIMVICDKNRDRCESTMTVCLPSNSFLAKSQNNRFGIQSLRLVFLGSFYTIVSVDNCI